MRLSDAIALGRMLALPWERGNRGGGRKCAMMLAGLAANGDCGDFITNLPFAASDSTVTLPCICKGLEGEWPCLNGIGNMRRATMHVFNHHVCTVGDWTLDQLIDWVRSVEPAEVVEVAHAEIAHGDRAEVNT